MSTTANVGNNSIAQNLSLENLPKEIWKPVKGFEGLYAVSNLGRIKSLPKIIIKPNFTYLSKEKILKGTLNSGKYLLVGLYKNQKRTTTAIHLQVAISFLNYDLKNRNNLVCDHKNNIATDNKLSNLQIITQRENASKDRKNKSSNFTGVSLCKKRWVSQIHVNNKTINLGRFKSEIEAKLAYNNKLSETQL